MEAQIAQVMARGKVPTPDASASSLAPVLEDAAQQLGPPRGGAAPPLDDAVPPHVDEVPAEAEGEDSDDEEEDEGTEMLGDMLAEDAAIEAARELQLS